LGPTEIKFGDKTFTVLPDGNVLVVVPTGSIEAISACGSVIAHAGNKVVVQSGKVQIGETVLEVSQDKAVPATAAPATLVNKEATLVGDKGIFICEIKLKGISQKFNLYAAPKDICPGALAKFTGNKIENIQKKLAKNEDWLGHGCTPFNNTENLIDNLKSGHYGGQWFTPNFDMLKDFIT
jgi:hypothetical protein